MIIRSIAQASNTVDETVIARKSRIAILPELSHSSDAAAVQF
jgi:hypothetical protein